MMSKKSKKAKAAKVTKDAVTTAAPVSEQIAPAPKAKAKEAVVKAPLEERNGVKKPREGGVCRQVWDWLDDHRDATAKDVREMAEANELNVSNASQEASRWRRFHGVSKPTAKAA